MKTLKYAVVFTFLLISLTGCGNLFYLTKLGWHQGSITFHSVPVQEILQDEAINAGVKERIRFIQEVKRYGEERLGLERTKSYSKFFEAKGPILYVVTASEKDRLQLYSWDFPIVGRVTYKGFFTQEGALEEEGYLREKGFDTFVQPSSAYSTLGWLKDPIFSSMLKSDDASLSNLILHEMAHATVYFRGETSLNEQVATFIGNRGAIDFLTEKYGPESKEVIEAIRIQEDDLLFARWIDRSCQRLSNLYGKEISRDEKLKEREEVFQSIKQEFKEINVRFKTDYYKNFEKVDINNAVLLAFHRYVDQLEKFQTLFERLGWNLRMVTAFFKEIRSTKGGPTAFLAQWMEEKGITGPNFKSDHSKIF